MSAVFIALPVALLLALVALAAFVWSVRSGQMDDLETPGYRVLVEEEGGEEHRGGGEDKRIPFGDSTLAQPTTNRREPE